ncbi:uncharacterized protein LOC113798310 [Dermatophagoides pteronyssinus]|uniref:uncharacterized protein LOC113798310 n=1 Tax=Dermatophagoides pteronyssinus TaxID=6956 RepID=UPI003F67B42B
MNSKRIFLHLLLIIINNVKTIILHDYDTVRFAYKPVYGLPKSLQCSESVYHKFNECEISSHREWKIWINEYFYETKEFCCFVWQAMACEIEIAAKCNRNYSQQIETSTRKSFTSMCDKIGSSQRSWSCWWTEDMKSTIGLVVTAITIFLIVVGVYIGCRQYRANAKLKEQAKIGKKLNIPMKKLTAEDTGLSTIHSSEISTTKVNSTDKPVQSSKIRSLFGGKLEARGKPHKNIPLKTTKGKLTAADKPIQNVSDNVSSFKPPANDSSSITNQELPLSRSSSTKSAATAASGVSIKSATAAGSTKSTASGVSIKSAATGVSTKSAATAASSNSSASGVSIKTATTGVSSNSSASGVSIKTATTGVSSKSTASSVATIQTTASQQQQTPPIPDTTPSPSLIQSSTTTPPHQQQLLVYDPNLDPTNTIRNLTNVVNPSNLNVISRNRSFLSNYFNLSRMLPGFWQNATFNHNK